MSQHLQIRGCSLLSLLGNNRTFHKTVLLECVFQKKGAADENQYMRKRDKEKLKLLRKRLQEEREENIKTKLKVMPNEETPIVQDTDDDFNNKNVKSSKTTEPNKS